MDKELKKTASWSITKAICIDCRTAENQKGAEKVLKRSLKDKLEIINPSGDIEKEKTIKEMH